MRRSRRRKSSLLDSLKRQQRPEQSEKKAQFCLQDKVESPEPVSWSFLDFLYESDSEEESHESFNEIVRCLQPKFEELADDSIQCPPQEENRIVAGSDGSSEGTNNEEEKDFEGTDAENEKLESIQKPPRTVTVNTLRRSRRLQNVERIGTIQVTGVRRSARLTGKS
mmetsp:Transcript_6459/g.15699  ORF Transcript_6459/g.15699 Transcript_6459/m.15699 type:complete len:167 (+) Transcript_6459:142-642(+)